ncbi:50S ribosomal protein L4 [Candidatus Microgenomates bacterium]|nr:50S ribosomal protein L4 [Candidatus Microgenomates bacterium]
MLKLDTYTLKGTKVANSLVLPKEIEEKENLALLAQAMHVYRDRSHIGHAKAKTRAEIARTTKKVYKQKGTGGARHGSRRAPIYVGGGVAHGPKLIEKSLSLTSKMKKKALNIALSLKVKNDQVIAVDDLKTIKKTKDVASLIKKLGLKAKLVIVLSKDNSEKIKFMKNLKDVKIVSFSALNAYDIVTANKVIIDADSFAKTKEVKKETKPVVKKVVKKETKKK